MKKTFTLITLLLIALVPAAVAQVGRPCPDPVTITITGESHPPAPDQTAFGSAYAGVAGSQWNQTAVNKHFGTTFHFPPRGCCDMTSGKIVITLKALQGGAPNSSTSWNDDIVLFTSGPSNNFYNQRIWQPQTSAVATGATRVITVPIPANVLALGSFSLYVEDDTAVVSAHVTLEGCCHR